MQVVRLASCSSKCVSKKSWALVSLFPLVDSSPLCLVFLKLLLSYLSIYVYVLFWEAPDGAGSRLCLTGTKSRGIIISLNLPASHSPPLQQGYC